MLPYSEQGKFKENTPSPDHNTELDYFFSHAYHDMRFFLNSTTKASSSVYTYFGDPQKNLYYISDNMRDTFGFSHNLVEDLPNKWRDFIYKDNWRLYHDRDNENVYHEHNSVHDIWYQVVDKNGDVHWIRDYKCLQWNDEKTKVLFVAGRLAKQDDHFSVDPLTNFPMEHTLHYRLDGLKQLKREYKTIGFCINHMSDINTKYGRNIGDRLIQTIAKSLMDEYTGKMTFYRLNGMCYMAIVDDSVTKSYSSLVSELRLKIESVYEELDIYAYRPCSFAVMNFPKENMETKDFVETMCSLIKLAASEHSQKYIENTKENIERINDYANMRMTLDSDVLHGMRNFKMVIQPIVSAETGHITGGECLLRWSFNGRAISPADFIPILEESQLIQIAGKWVLEEAIKACREMVKILPDCYLSVNLSICQLGDLELYPFISETLDKYHLDGRNLVLEITESYMPKEPEELRNLINACYKKEINVALDDFGTGYSTLSNLLYYNLNFIKIDRSLLLEMEKSEDKEKFITTVIDAFHKLGKKICMEGVETDRQKLLAQTAGCDYIQGFYFYRPSQVEDVLEMLKQ